MRLYLDVPLQLTDYIKGEITFVNYVRDAYDADVNVLITLEPICSGGGMYTISLIGEKAFEGINDTR